MQILQQYQHKSPRTNPSKYPEKSVDDTTEEEFDVDAIMKGNDFTKKTFIYPHYSFSNGLISQNYFP